MDWKSTLYLSIFFKLLLSVKSDNFLPFDCDNREALNDFLKERERNESTLFTEFADIVRQENLTDLLEMDDARESNFNVSDILPINQTWYLRRRPPIICGFPATAVYHITVLALDSINESSMTYNADIYLTVSWIDHRLRFPSSRRAFRLLEPTWLNNLWRPDTIFRNARKVTFHEKVVPNHYLLMLPSRALVYVSKLTLVLACGMDFHDYPHDTQECDIRIESMTYTTKELIFKWDVDKPLGFSMKGGVIQTPQFKSVHNMTDKCEVGYSSGNYSCIKAVFFLRRRLGYHIMHTYFPSGFIVVLSWFTFWIKPRDIAARIGLGVTSLLTLVTLNTQSQELLPPVSYTKAIDLWMCSCALFVFAAILEFAIVNYLICRFPVDPVDIEEIKAPGNMKARVVKFISNHQRIQGLAHNIDRFSRVFFPTCFVVLNVWYITKYSRKDDINGVRVYSE